MQTYTVDQVCAAIPAIGNPAPSDKTSDRYQFIDTREALEHAEDHGWRIVEAEAQSKSPSSCHHIVMVRNEDLANIDDLKDSQEGILRLEMFNSHNRTKRFMFGVGYFRFICSNGMIVSTGPTEMIRTKHRFSDDRLTSIREQLLDFPVMAEKALCKIEQFQDRAMTESEMRALAKYAIHTRFAYRQTTPRRWQKVEDSVTRLLAPRRDEDTPNTLWHTFNRVQENILKGMEGFSRPVKSYIDRTRVNSKLWTGAALALEHKNANYIDAIAELMEPRK